MSERGCPSDLMPPRDVWRFAVAVMIAASAMRAHGQTLPAAPADAASATVALVETWPDGRINYELTSARRAVMWTPQFPKIAGYKVPDGTRPVYAVQFARVLVGTDIKVDVS